MTKHAFRRVGSAFLAVIAGLACYALIPTTTAYASPVGSNCNDSSSFSVQVCIYQYGVRTGSNFVIDHYGATFIRKDRQARLTSGTIHTGTLVDGNYDMGVSSPTSGQEYTFRPPNSGRSINVSGNGFACGRAELHWARGTGTSYTESFSVCQGNSNLFGSGGDHGGKVNVAPNVSPAGTADASSTPANFFTVAHTSTPASLGGGRYVQTETIGYVPATSPSTLLMNPDTSMKPASSTQSLCSNDGSVTVSVCVEQFYTLSGSYVAVDHYTATATRHDAQARLTKLRGRASVLGECLPSSCSGVRNDVQDFAQSAPSSGVAYPFQPRWHGNFTAYNSANRYQCGIAFLDWARGSSTFTLQLTPPVCIGRMP